MDWEERLIFAINERSISLRQIRKSRRTYHICLAAVRHNGYQLQYVPTSERTPYLVQRAVMQNGLSLSLAALHQQNLDIRLCAVKQNGWALKYIPRVYRTHEICLAAITDCPFSISYISQDEMRLEYYLAAGPKECYSIYRFVDPIPEHQKIIVWLYWIKKEPELYINNEQRFNQHERKQLICAAYDEYLLSATTLTSSKYPEKMIVVFKNYITNDIDGFIPVLIQIIVKYVI